VTGKKTAYDECLRGSVKSTEPVIDRVQFFSASEDCFHVDGYVSVLMLFGLGGILGWGEGVDEANDPGPDEGKEDCGGGEFNEVKSAA
jgi:hypothetical protein